ncbi:MAG: DUF5947 family protein, partial [Candidatus Limnocylindrales bacterium]
TAPGGASVPASSPIDLRRFLEPPPRAVPGERCEFCAETLSDEHSHVVNVESRSLMCSCRGCWFLFAPDGAAAGKYRAVPEDVVRDPAFVLTDADWESLQIPVGMAFFFHQSDLAQAVAFYPGPAGATESLLPLETWQQLVSDNPILATMLPDVQALLVYRPPGDSVRQTFIVPIDVCYELVGIIRRFWKGFDGGQEAGESIAQFFEQLTERSRPPARTAFSGRPAAATVGLP